MAITGTVRLQTTVRLWAYSVLVTISGLGEHQRELVAGQLCEDMLQQLQVVFRSDGMQYVEPGGNF